jgi:hypothetical protein
MEKFKRFIEANEWIFAKTMPEVPHCYTLKHKADDKDEFIEFANYIKDNGIQMKWGPYQRPYLDIGDYRYWVMDKNPNDAKIINREEIKVSKAVAIE